MSRIKVIGKTLYTRYYNRMIAVVTNAGVSSVAIIKMVGGEEVDDGSFEGTPVDAAEWLTQQRIRIDEEMGG